MPVKKATPAKKAPPAKPTAAKGKPPASKAASNGAVTGKVAGWDQFSKAGKKVWDKAKKAKAGSFEQPDVPDGTYVGKLVKATLKVFPAKDKKNAAAVFQRTYVITRGGGNDEVVGLQPKRDDWFNLPDNPSNDEADDTVKFQTNMEYFAKDIQGCGYNSNNLSLDDFPDLMKNMNDAAKSKENAEIKISIKNTTGSDGKNYMKVYANGYAEDE